MDENNKTKAKNDIHVLSQARW